MRGRLFWFLVAASIIFAGHLPVSGLAAEEIANEDCLACHDSFNLDEFHGSVHGGNLCTSCHVEIKELPHPEKMSPVNCASCHRMEASVYLASDHGKAMKHGIAAAKCFDCHGDSHSIYSARDAKSPVYRLNIPKTCAVCHENQEKMAKYALLEKHPLTSYAETVHGKALLEKQVMSSAVCTDCHGSHDLHAPTNPQSKIYRKNVPDTCGKCHENVLRTYERSVHGQAAMSGKVEAPVCTDCHGEHNIRGHKDPRSTVYTTTVSEKTCGHCHGAEKIVTKYRLPSDRVKTYLESYHGLASKFGMTMVANCASCHGAHDILPSNDPESSVNKKNLPQTCGRCHPNVGEQLAKGSIHIAPSSNRDQIVFFVGAFYIGLIVIVIGGMVIHNLLDFSQKLREHYRRKREEGKVVRFTRNERIQHALLTLSFTGLAYTGFALKFSEAWWAFPFSLAGGETDWRGTIHRGLAVIFVVLSGYHLFYLILTKRGRGQLKAMMPLIKDFTDFFLMTKHNMGLEAKRPKFERYSYIEKAEYWALIWGSLVMIVTGFLLTFENFTMKYFPKWAYDVANAIHFYEAVLATLAIIVWHFYFTVFDPEHYPMNWSMWTGRAKEEPGEEGKGKA